MCFIIFGWGNQKIAELAIDKDKCKCENCNNEISYHLVRVRTWFDIFFIPIIPYSTKYWFLCPICNMGYRLTKDEVNEMLVN